MTRAKQHVPSRVYTHMQFYVCCLISKYVTYEKYRLQSSTTTAAPAQSNTSAWPVGKLEYTRKLQRFISALKRKYFYGTYCYCTLLYVCRQ